MFTLIENSIKHEINWYFAQSLIFYGQIIVYIIYIRFLCEKLTKIIKKEEGVIAISNKNVLEYILLFDVPSSCEINIISWF